MESENVFETVKQSIVSSCGVAEEKIQPDTTLFAELGIDSIDLVDILYMLEREYKISLKISDINKRAREALGGKPFEVDGIITAEGLGVLRQHMPEVSNEKLKPGATIYDLIQMLTVRSLVNMVMHKLEEKK